MTVRHPVLSEAVAKGLATEGTVGLIERMSRVMEPEAWAEMDAGECTCDARFRIARSFVCAARLILAGMVKEV